MTMDNNNRCTVGFFSSCCGVFINNCTCVCSCVVPFQGKMFFIMVDAHSKWPEVMTMSSTTTQHTIDALTAVFARYGLPDQLVFDNGPQFTSCEFGHFLKRNGIKHRLRATSALIATVVL